MSAKTKIIVLHAKELVTAGILAAVGLFLILLLTCLFLPGKDKKTSDPALATPAPKYRPGVYVSSLRLGDKSIEVETILEKDRIASVRLVNLEEAITTAYPLLAPTMESICAQVCENQSLENVKTESGARYTSLALLSAIQKCLDQGAIPSSPDRTDP